MTAFKIGDRVRLIKEGTYGYGIIGQEGTIRNYHSSNSEAPGVNFDIEHHNFPFYVHDRDLELIHPEMQYDPEQQGDTEDSI